MSNTEKHKQLFRYATITEIVAMFQSLLEARDVEAGEALALAGAIHAGLRKPQGPNAPYARYARVMALLNHNLPEVYEHVAANWRLPHMRPASKRTYTDSLFDDTAVMPVPGSKKWLYRF